MVLILLQIRQRNLENPSFQSIVGVLNTGGPVDESLSDTVDLLEAVCDVLDQMVVIAYSLMLNEDGACEMD